MRLGETFRSSFKSLFHNKLRSFLTMLGVIIGIFSVIMLTSIGEGVKQKVVSQVESIGSNLLYVLPGKVQIGFGKTPSRLGQTTGRLVKSNLNYEDVLALKGNDHISAVTGIASTTATLDKLALSVTVTGVDEDFNKIRDIELDHGRFINLTEREAGSLVTVIGQQANKEIFKGGNSVGRTFSMNDQEYTVVGILKYKKPENLGPQAEDINVKIYVPITDMFRQTKERAVSQIIVQADSSNNVSDAEKTVRSILKQRHPDQNFSILKEQDILNVVNSIISIITAGLGGIAAISLIVGGIGIMNIMLVSVSERTREIGIRKAIGAKNRDILIQFLIEAIILSLIGGFLGVLAGYGGTELLPELIPEVQTVLSIPAVIISLAFALLVGIFFGVYPAAKAARLNPIEALRSE